MNTNPLLSDAMQRACAYLETLPERAVAPSSEGIAGLKQLDEPLPAAPSDPMQTLAFLDEAVDAQQKAAQLMAVVEERGYITAGQTSVCCSTRNPSNRYSIMKPVLRP